MEKQKKNTWNLSLPGAKSNTNADAVLKQVGIEITEICAVDAEDERNGYTLSNSIDTFCAAVAGWLLDNLNIELDDYVQFSRHFLKTKKISISRVLVFAKDGKNYDAMCDNTFARAIITKILQMIVDKHKGTKDWVI